MAFNIDELLNSWLEWAAERELDSLDGQMGDTNDTAENYMNAGLSPEQALEWIEAGGWDADSVAELIEAGYSPQEMNKISGPDEGIGCYEATYASKFCNGDLDLSGLTGTEEE